LQHNTFGDHNTENNATTRPKTNKQINKQRKKENEEEEVRILQLVVVGGAYNYRTPSRM
jgi:hypothetical protein